MDLKKYRVQPRRFYAGMRVAWTDEDGHERLGQVGEDDERPTPEVLFDGASEPVPCAVEDLRLTAGQYPEEA